jgi:peptidyl-tRNA hydrolase, PTH1 family
LRAIVGLGNPGKRYELTRHNVGFQILDRFALKHKLDFSASKKNYYISEGSAESSDFFLIKPTTYMNLSGEAVLNFLEQHPVQAEEILVIVDDVNLLVGQVRLRKSGSDGGHNGIKSIIYQLQSDQFPRLRFGVGNDFEKGEMADFVLDTFKNEEIETVEKSMEFSVELLEEFVYGGYKPMLDFYSRNWAKIMPKNEEKEYGDIG